MKSKRTYRIMAITIVVVMAITGFGIAELLATNKDGDREEVVAEVNGEKILKGEFMDIYEQQKIYYGITEDNENSSENSDNIKSLKSDILESLIYEKLVAQKAKEAGYTVSDETLEQAQKEFNETLDVLAEQLKTQAGEDTAEEVDYAKEAQKYVDEQLMASGITSDDYIKMLAEQIAVDNFYNETTKGINVTEKETMEYYDAQLAVQKDDPLSSAYAEVQLYEHPKVRVKHILISLPEEEQEEYTNLLKEEKEEEAKEYLEEKLKAIYPKAKEALDKAKAGEDFEKLIEDYGQDPGMVDNEEGYIVGRDGQYAQEFEDAAFGLQEGELSGLVSSNFGYHIIKAYENISDKTYSLEDKKDEIKELLDSQKKDEKWNSILEEWMKNAAVTRYEDWL